MNRTKMYEKYNAAMRSMFAVTGDSDSECLDKLIYTYKNLGNPNAEKYDGIPEGFDWESFGEDYKELVKA